MSADNGYVVKKKDGGFYVYHSQPFFEHEKVEDMDFKKKFKTLEEAMEYASEQFSEYGVRYIS